MRGRLHHPRSLTFNHLSLVADSIYSMRATRARAFTGNFRHQFRLLLQGNLVREDADFSSRDANILNGVLMISHTLRLCEFLISDGLAASIESFESFALDHGFLH